ncbi:hypothetical protein F5884DRAFT_754327 [Xylogone sp. PMI_703]|nr:hypothetical protein F5884DRAFT_754327 [Xylogone sp. PMI_703]
METTFITIHNANVLFASDSITDVLGYSPEDVMGRSCFDYFHPEEVPMARYIHNNGVQLDKAAVLHYCRIQNKHGDWIGCECIFTIVYDVMVACTSIYRGDAKNERRAIEAPTIRRIFTSSPRDPRYHMLEYLSSKFKTDPQAGPREPRAALILNRFTRTLTVMYATNAVSAILGISAEDITGKSFYEFIQENCLRAAVLCLESAKANDSIAYLRFWYRDPLSSEDDDNDQMDTTSGSDDEEEDVVVKIEEDMDASFPTHQSQNPIPGNTGPNQPEQLEIEAVVSCTSDGLVVVLRRARPLIPDAQKHLVSHEMASGIFAAPWGLEPVRLPSSRQHLNNPQHAFAPNDTPFYAPITGSTHSSDDFMRSIRSLAVFAWSVIGINGNIASYSRGTPTGQAQPPDGLPIWEPQSHGLQDYDSPKGKSAVGWDYMDESSAQSKDPGDPYGYLNLEGDHSYPSRYNTTPGGRDSNSYTLAGHNAGREALHHSQDQYNYQPRGQSEHRDHPNEGWPSTSTELDLNNPSSLSNQPRWGP